MLIFMKLRKKIKEFNQGMMELGATVCSPHNPDCLNCPIQAGCIATKNAKTDSSPYKSKAK